GLDLPTGAERASVTFSGPAWAAQAFQGQAPGGGAQGSGGPGMLGGPGAGMLGGPGPGMLGGPPGGMQGGPPGGMLGGPPGGMLGGPPGGMLGGPPGNNPPPKAPPVNPRDEMYLTVKPALKQM